MVKKIVKDMLQFQEDLQQSVRQMKAGAIQTSNFWSTCAAFQAFSKRTDQKKTASKEAVCKAMNCPVFISTSSRQTGTTGWLGPTWL